MAGMNGFAGPYAIVEEKFRSSMSYAHAAMDDVSNFQQGLVNSIYKPSLIDVKWSTLAAPNLPPIPDYRALDTEAMKLNEPGGMPAPLTATMRDVAIDDIDLDMPVLDFGRAPELTIGTVPVLPEVRDVALPDAPTVTLPDVPEFLSLQTHSFGGVNLHEDWLKKLDELPTLSILEPAPFNYQPGAKYASQLLENLKATLNARIHGGTGLAPVVEQQIWDRARDRETQVALAREQEVMRAAEALGFPLPSGVMAGQLADARREYLDKLSGLSRDVAIKQAELEQQNLRDSIASALQLENMLMDDCHRMERLAFDTAKAVAEHALASYNGALAKFQALLAGYQAYASAYDSIIRAELAKVEVFKALLSAEEVKANINKTLVDRYKAEIEGRMAAVEIYKARVGAAQTLVEIEKTRIEAGGEQVKAFVATVNAETAKAELYKVRVSAETAKVGAVEAMARAYSAKVGGQAEKARTEVARYQALISQKGMEWDGWKARLQGEVARIDALSRASSVAADAYRIGASAAEAQAGSLMRRWEADLKQYEAGKELVFRVQKANSDATHHANDARMEANKIGLTTSAQQVASAWSAVSAQAEVGARVTESHDYKY
jgi:hypothetical protein